MDDKPESGATENSTTGDAVGSQSLAASASIARPVKAPVKSPVTPAKTPVASSSSSSGDSVLLKILIVFGFLAIGITSSTTIRLSKPKYGTVELNSRDGGESDSKSHGKATSHADDDGKQPGEPGGESDAAASESASAGQGSGKEGADKHDPKHAPVKKDEKFVAETLESADKALRAGRFPDALKLIRTLTSQSDAAPTWHYREGLCQEALGRSFDAIKAYEKASNPDSDPYLWAISTLGRVRSKLLLGDLEKASNMLIQVELRSGHPKCRDRQILEECLVQRARLEIDRFGQRASLDPLDRTAIAWAKLSGGIENYLDWLPLPKEADASAPSPISAGEKILVQKASESPKLHSITADRPDSSVLALLKELANATELSLELEKAAESALSRQVISIEVEKMPLATLLTSMTQTFGLRWSISENVLAIRSAGDESPSRSAARELVQIAADRAPGHPRHLAVRLASPNLSFEENRWKEASTGFRRILADVPHSPESLQAAYNLGLTALQLGENSFARVAFQNAIDRGLVDLGWWWIGRSHLEDGDTTKALKPLRRALSGKDRAARSAAVLGIATAHMLNADPEEAQGVLSRNRVLPDERHMVLASMFESWIRFRKNPTSIRGENLLTCIQAAEECEQLGTAGVFLAGQAYRDLGQPRLMASLYSQTVGHVRGNLAVKMNFALAEHDWNNFQFDKASTHYKAIAAIDPEGYGPMARHRLAEIALKKGKGDECVAHCRWLVNRPEMNRENVLVLMGRGYEKEGEYRMAAECFAGRVPEDSQGESLEK